MICGFKMDGKILRKRDHALNLGTLSVKITKKGFQKCTTSIKQDETNCKL